VVFFDFFGGNKIGRKVIHDPEGRADIPFVGIKKSAQKKQHQLI
jgi:hypothetical protein